VHRPIGVATLPTRVEDRADEYCQGQRTKCDYQREHRLLLSAANGTTEQMPKCGMQRAELLHTMEWPLRTHPRERSRPAVRWAVFYARARRFSSTAACDHLRRRRQVERHQIPNRNTATKIITAMISAAASVRWSGV